MGESRVILARSRQTEKIDSKVTVLETDREIIIISTQTGDSSDHIEIMLPAILLVSHGQRQPRGPLVAPG